MKTVPVKSSSIHRIGYDSKENRLHVEFKNDGGTYEYHGVSPEAYQALLNAASVGAHFHKHIRNKHRTVRISKSK